MFRSLFLLFTCCCVWTIGASLHADDWSLENVTSPAANSAEEAMAGEFSLQKATHFLDQVSLDWTKSRQCFTCHTNFAYLIARPLVSAESVAHHQLRDKLEELVEVRWETEGPRWDSEVVMSAAVLAMNDAATTNRLHPTTRVALDRMWEVQREDGGIDWLRCGWPPMESDDHFGVVMMALAVGAAPDSYRDTPAAKQGLEKLFEYLAANPAPTVHHRAMLLWADSYLPNLVSPEQQEATVEELFSLQKSDGGWNVATLGDWRRHDGQPQDTESSDGYGTGFVITVLRRAGVAANDPRIQNGIDWLKSNQRESGRWFTRSLSTNHRHYLSHVGSAFAVMAITSCETEVE